MRYTEIESAVKEAYEGVTLVRTVLADSARINQKGNAYWCVAFDIQRVTDYEDYQAIDLAIYALERHNGIDDSRHYEKGMEILKEGFLRLEDKGIDLSLPATYEFATLRYADVLDCVTATVTLTLAREGDCDA